MVSHEGRNTGRNQSVDIRHETSRYGVSKVVLLKFPLFYSG